MKKITFKDTINNFEEIIALFAFIILIISMAAQVIWRYVLNNPLVWTEELGRVAFIWVSFMGASIAMKKGRHIKIDSIFNIFPERIRKLLEYFIQLLLLFFLSIVFYNGLILIKKTIYGSTSAMGIPNIIYYLPVALGSFLMIIYVIRLLVTKSFMIKK